MLGYGISQIYLGAEDPFGQQVTIGSTRFTVVGVMQPKGEDS